MEELFRKIKSLRRNAVEIEAAVPTQEKKLRLVVLGAPRVGKTQLVSRFLGRPFSQSYVPTIEDFQRMNYIIDGCTYQLDVLDTSGQILSPAMQNLTLLTGDIFLVVYSTAEHGTWNRARDIVTMIEEVTSDASRTNRCIARNFKNVFHSHGGSLRHDKFENGISVRSEASQVAPPVPILLVGNKSDIPITEVESDEVTTWLLQRENIPTSRVEHIITSAKTNYNIQDLYDRLFTMSHLPIELSLARHRKVTESEYSSNISLLARHSRTKHQKLKSVTSSGNKVNGLNILEDHQSAEPRSDRAPSDDNESTAHAIASLCPYQRRPSIDTEVLLAIGKVRCVSSDGGSKVDTTNDSKFKKGISKLTRLVSN